MQALMALLGHVSAARSLRCGRLFDASVRQEYERLAGGFCRRVLPARSSPGHLH